MKWYIYENDNEIFLVPGILQHTTLTYKGYIGEYNSYNEANEAILKYGYINLIIKEDKENE